MNRRSFLSLFAALPVVGKYWKPKPEYYSYMVGAGKIAPVSVSRIPVNYGGKVIYWYRYDLSEKPSETKTEKVTIDGQV